jgi:hypothetical protein
MLSRGRLDLTWNDIQEWTNDETSQLGALRDIIRNGEIMRLVETRQTQRLLFRHDRVRAWLLCDAVAWLIESGKMSDAIISEPFFADVIGMAIPGLGLPEAVDLVRTSAPLSLFYALKEFREPKEQQHRAILEAIKTWLDSEETHGRSNGTVRWEALQVLSETESSNVIAITDQFRERPRQALAARFRNGDLSAGFQLCLLSQPGVHDRWRDRQIAHAKVRFGKAIVRTLNDMLKKSDLPSNGRSGALRLDGHFADSDLAEGIVACWDSDAARDKHLDDYLWAAAECCGDYPERLLGPVCNSWAALPNEKEANSVSRRNDLAANEISWAFKEKVSTQALQYFIQRASDQDLHWPITYMLREIDHPAAVEHIAREFAAYSREAKGTGGFWPFPSHVIMQWERQQRDRGQGMSTASRQKLQELWSNPANDEHLRQQSLRLWAATTGPGDIEALRQASSEVVLKDDVLRARLDRGDKEAIPEFISKAEGDEEGYWWQFVRRVWSDDLSRALGEALQRRGRAAKHEWGFAYRNDWMVSQIIMGLKPIEAEQLLSKHWATSASRHTIYKSRSMLPRQCCPTCERSDIGVP